MQKILIGFASILLLTSCDLLVSTGSQKTEQTAEVPVYQTVLDTTSGKIKDTKEFAGCMQGAVNSCINSVGMQLAEKTKSSEFCNELRSKEQQDGCHFAVTVGNASEKDDPTLCANLTGEYKLECLMSTYKNRALKNQDVQVCSEMKAKMMGSATSNGEAGSTDSFTNQYEQCILGVLMTRSDTTEEGCKTITDTELRNMCTLSIKKKAVSPSQTSTFIPSEK